LVGSVPCPSSTVGGISLMPGTGCPLVMSSTMWANEVGYGAAGSLEFVGAGGIPAGASSLPGRTSSTTEEARTSFEVGGVGGGLLRALRYALYASKSIFLLYFLEGLSTAP
jgi:hypothetical protein